MRSAFVLLALAACGGGGDDGSSAPTMLRASGAAEAEAGADRVECSFQIDVIDLVETADGWSGVATGEVFRRPMPDGGVFEFSALVGGPATIARSGATVEARLVGDQPDDAPEFWLALEAITATETGELEFAGAWTCAPILLDDPGFDDVDLDGAGTWTLEPL